MHEIICPHCGKAFKIDEAGYADILKQVRDSEFDKQLHERLELAAQDKRNAVELAPAEPGHREQYSEKGPDIGPENYVHHYRNERERGENPLHEERSAGANSSSWP